DTSFNRKMAAIGLDRLYLHAESICFTLPDVHSYDIQAPLDSSLETPLTKLDKL
ncbi:MAG: 23S rRNA pseudouridine(955/2504/2580) synthase, partial [Mariprofundaceae bacterium]|nr:23S rRNA pseudouridine(955/2504/2580) synthase [Mariprofundaceae bacterium]